MAKRSNGEGTIAKRPNGRWMAAVTIDGKRIYHSAGTRRECEEWRKDLIGQISNGLTSDGTKIRLSEFIDTWLSVKKKNIRLSTQEQYGYMIRIYILPNLGSLTMKELNPLVIQRFYDQLSRNGVSNRTIEVVHTVLHGILEHGRKIGLVSQNWTEKVEVPRPAPTEMQVWDENQVSQFIISLPENLQPFYRLAFATGMRKGEIIGLRWIDIDWIAGLLKITRQVYRPAGGGWQFQPPKTDRGRRSIRLGSGIISALKYQFSNVVPTQKALAGAGWQENDLIFPSSIGTPLNDNNLSRDFTKRIDQANLPHIRFHDIRHTAASIMLIHNTPPIQVAAILGQSLNVLMTTYAHYIPGGEEYPASIMDQITTPISIEIPALTLKG